MGIESISLVRSPFWLVVGIVFFLFFVFILGAGIGPLSGLGDQGEIQAAQLKRSSIPHCTSLWTIPSFATWILLR
jgi:hypothetical protein